MKKILFSFKVIDYHKGDTHRTLDISTLQELKKFKDNNAYKQVWPDFDNGILWVTEYRKFSEISWIKS